MTKKQRQYFDFFFISDLKNFKEAMEADKENAAKFYAGKIFSQAEFIAAVYGPNNVSEVTKMYIAKLQLPEAETAEIWRGLHNLHGACYGELLNLRFGEI